MRLSRRGKRIVGIVVALALGYAGLCALARASSRRFLYHPPPPAPLAAPGAELITARAADGAEARALFFPPPRAGARTVVHFHGNAEQASDEIALARDLRARGLGAL